MEGEQLLLPVGRIFEKRNHVVSHILGLKNRNFECSVRCAVCGVAVVIRTRVCYGKRAILLGAEGKGVEGRAFSHTDVAATPFFKLV